MQPRLETKSYLLWQPRCRLFLKRAIERAMREMFVSALCLSPGNSPGSSTGPAVVHTLNSAGRQAELRSDAATDRGTLIVASQRRQGQQ